MQRNYDKRGDLQPGREYEFKIRLSPGETKTVKIRGDTGGHIFGPNDPQNRGAHFNDH
ncbi:HNH/endonuclease VII fold putative polymorphic toxin [Acidovorax sp. NCPPB 4044]|uniref:HNH/endonuclease VII fold putative polymorphic toxin n=1 Tax=Acidovorax sp. NCPPB 4044 TaxID=2940490 RepID=UPI003FA4B636